MQINSISVALVALLPIATATLLRRIVNDPEGAYLNSMCLPIYTNHTSPISINGRVAALKDSPFPCEQALYIQALCTANGTQEVDFLAEQECLCGGTYFYAEEGCDNCYYQHGFHGVSPKEAATSRSSISAAECTPSPAYQPYSNLLPSVNFSTIAQQPPITLTDDKAPNNTAVSVYFTETKSVTPGEITGSATGRQLTWTNTDGNRFTPTATPTGTTRYGTPSSSSSSSASGSGSASGSSGSSGNAAAKSQMDFMRCLLAGVFGTVILL